jgi:DNA-directed RNA polymerase specialized sigma24 family protein
MLSGRQEPEEPAAAKKAIPDPVMLLPWGDILRQVTAALSREHGADADDIADVAVCRAVQDPRTAEANDPVAWVLGYARNVAHEEDRRRAKQKERQPD